MKITLVVFLLSFGFAHGSQGDTNGILELDTSSAKILFETLPKSTTKLTYIKQEDLESHANEYLERNSDLIDVGEFLFEIISSETRTSSDSNIECIHETYLVYSEHSYAKLVQRLRLKGFLRSSISIIEFVAGSEGWFNTNRANKYESAECIIHNL